MLRNRFLFVLLVTIFSGGVSMASEKPKVIVNVIIDALRKDDFDRYSKNFSVNGLRRMIDNGAVLTNARYENIPNSPMVSGATIITGSWPHQHGIVGDFWYNNGSTQITGAITIGKDTAYTKPLYSILDKIKYCSPEAKIVSIGIDPKSTIVSGDSDDRIVWLDNITETWVTSKGSEGSPWWVTTLNNGRTKARYMETPITPSLPIVNYVNKSKTTLFNSANKGKGSKVKSLTETPYCNSFLNDCLSSLLVFDKIGKDTICDYLTINYGYSKYVYQKYGANSIEVEDMYYKLDSDMARLIQMLDSEIGKGEYVVIFTSASGSSDCVEGVINETRIRVLTNAFLNTQYGIADWVAGYNNGQIYLNHNTIYNKKVGLDVIQDAVASFVLKFEGVENTLTSSALMRNNFTSGVEKSVYNSFNAPASGDVMVVLKPNWVSLPNGDATKDKAAFCTPYENNLSIPLIIYGKGVKPGKFYNEVYMTDIAPTVSDMLNISRPEKSIGNSFYNIIKYDN